MPKLIWDASVWLWYVRTSSIVIRCKIVLYINYASPSIDVSSPYRWIDFFIEHSLVLLLLPFSLLDFLLSHLISLPHSISIFISNSSLLLFFFPFFFFPFFFFFFFFYFFFLLTSSSSLSSSSYYYHYWNYLFLLRLLYFFFFLTGYQLPQVPSTEWYCSVCADRQAAREAKAGHGFSLKGESLASPYLQKSLAFPMDFICSEGDWIKCIMEIRSFEWF